MPVFVAVLKGADFQETLGSVVVERSYIVHNYTWKIPYLFMSQK